MSALTLKSTILFILSHNAYSKTLFYSDMDDLSEGAWTITSDQPSFYGSSSSSHVCSSSKCSFLTRSAVIKKKISTVNYESIKLTFDLNVGYDSELGYENLIWSRGYAFYSCFDDVTHNMFEFIGNYTNTTEFWFPQRCNNVHNLYIYFAAWTSSSLQRIYLDNVRVTGAFNNNQEHKTATKETIFHDDMSNYKMHWSKINDYVTQSYQSYCLNVPCTKLSGNGEIRMKLGLVETHNHKNIELHYDVNIGANEVLDYNDEFRLFFSCDIGSNPVELVNEYSGQSNMSYFFAGEYFRFPEKCDLNDDNYLLLELHNDATSEDVWISNLRIVGERVSGYEYGSGNDDDNDDKMFLGTDLDNSEERNRLVYTLFVLLLCVIILFVIVTVVLIVKNISLNNLVNSLSKINGVQINGKLELDDDDEDTLGELKFNRASGETQMAKRLTTNCDDDEVDK